MSVLYSNLFEARDTNGDGTNDSWSYRGPYANKQGEIVAFRATITATPSISPVPNKWRFIEVPKGARMLTLTELHTDLGGTVQGDLGWETTDPDAFSASDIDFHTVPSPAGTERCTPAIAIEAAATTGVDYLTVTFNVATTPASGTITLIGAYAITDGVGG